MKNKGKDEKKWQKTYVADFKCLKLPFKNKDK